MKQKPAQTNKQTLFYRQFPIEKRQPVEGEGESREYGIVFSSDTPVQRWYGYEILSHEPGAMRMERLNSGIPILLNHDSFNPDNHVGITLPNEGKVENGQGVTRFRLASEGVSEKADEAQRKIQDGILQSVSAGYMVHAAELMEEQIDGEDAYLITDWEPVENSLLPVPADFNATVVRQYFPFIHTRAKHVDEQTTIEETTNDSTRETEKTVLIQREGSEGVTEVSFSQSDLEAKLDEERKTRTETIKEIQTIKAKHYGNEKVREIADKAIESGKSLDEFRAQLIDILSPDQQVIDASENVQGYLGMERSDIARYSLARAVEATLTKNWDSAEFEVNCSNLIADRMDRAPKGIYVPLEILARLGAEIINRREQVRSDLGGYAYRAPPMDTTTNVHLVGTEHLAAQFIDALRPYTVLIRAGARVLPGLVQNVSLPALAGSAPYEFLDEDAPGTEVEATTRAVTLTPTTIATHVSWTRRLGKQSLPAIDAILLNDVTQNIGVGIDWAGIQGSGASAEPLGILNQTGVQVVPVGTPGSAPTEGQPTFQDIIAFETKQSEANADGLGNVYLTAHGVRGHCKGTPKFTNGDTEIWMNNEMNGYPAVSSSNVPQYKTIFGDMPQCLYGFWGTLDILMDWATKASSGGMVLRAFQDFDFNLRHGVSFVKSELAT